MKDLYIKYKEIIVYLIFGILTTIISLLSYFILTHSILNSNNAIEIQIANIISWVISVTFAYITNKKYVFEDKRKGFKSIIYFYLSRVTSLIIDMFLMFLLVTVFSFNDFCSKLVVQVIVIVLNYILSKFIVFRR